MQCYSQSSSGDSESVRYRFSSRWSTWWLCHEPHMYRVCTEIRQMPPCPKHHVRLWKCHQSFIARGALVKLLYKIDKFRLATPPRTLLVVSLSLFYIVFRVLCGGIVLYKKTTWRNENYIVRNFDTDTHDRSAQSLWGHLFINGVHDCSSSCPGLSLFLTSGATCTDMVWL